MGFEEVIEGKEDWEVEREVLKGNVEGMGVGKRVSVELEG